MDELRQLQARVDARGMVREWYCTACGWTLPRADVEVPGNRYRPEQLAALFFEMHLCESERGMQTESPLRARL